MSIQRELVSAVLEDADSTNADREKGESGAAEDDALRAYLRHRHTLVESATTRCSAPVAPAAGNTRQPPLAAGSKTRWAPAPSWVGVVLLQLSPPDVDVLGPAESPPHAARAAATPATQSLHTRMITLPDSA